MYICSVANLILKTRNLQPQQISQIQKFFEILKEHAEKIKPAPAEPPATTPTGSIP
jgi:hypothetical protein